MDWLIEKNPRWGLVLFTFACTPAKIHSTHSLSLIDQLARYQYHIYNKTYKLLLLQVGSGRGDDGAGVGGEEHEE